MKRSMLFVALMLFSVAGLAQGMDQDETEMSPQMQRMQEKMRVTRAQMERLHATEDPAERRRLMREHMQSMHEGMEMMGHMMREPMGQGRMQQCQRDDTECRMDRMQSQQRMMGQHMGMMHQMMEQMMEHMRRGPATDNGPAEGDDEND